MKVKCKLCGKQFNTCPAKIKDGRGKYCSRKCRDKARIKLRTVKCIVCGKVRTYTTREYGTRKRAALYCSVKCRNKHRVGDKHGRWKGGEYKRLNGYIMQYKGVNNHQRQHRFVMEKAIGRALTDSEVVHHINRNKTDNRIENLKIMTQSEHVRLHSNQYWAQKRKAI